MSKHFRIHTDAQAAIMAISLVFSMPLAAHGRNVRIIPADICIEIEVNGTRVPDYACLSRALSSTQDATQANPESALTGSEAIVRRPPTRMGLATPEATRQRMGNTFGTSTLPQRPERPPQTLPPGIRNP